VISDILKRHQESNDRSENGIKRKRVASTSRVRVSQACKACALSKLKCAQEKPCARCKQRNVFCEDAININESSEFNVDPLTRQSANDEDNGQYFVPYDVPGLQDRDGTPVAVEPPQLHHMELAPSSAKAGDHPGSTQQPATMGKAIDSEPPMQNMMSSTLNHASETYFPGFLRDLLMPGDPRLEFQATFEHSACHPHHITDFGIAIDHDFDS
jgi:hypothetical protein